MLLAVVVIIGIAAIAFNFGPTGQAVSSGEQSITKVFISANEDFIEDNPRVKAGSYVYIFVETGSDGSEARAKIYDLEGKNSLRKATFLLGENCGGTTCRPNKVTTGKYRTPTSWDKGDYFVAVKDKLTGKDVEAHFTLY